MSSRRLITLLVAFQVVVLAFKALTMLGLPIPILPALTALVYLTLLPGFLVLSILRVQGLGASEVLLYSVGVSITLVMLIGAIMNALYPPLGISRPISELPITITFGIILAILSAVAYWRATDLPSDKSLALRESFDSRVLFLALLPLLAALGAYLFNVYENDLLLLALMALIALMVVLMGFGRLIPRRLYPLAVWSIALVLVYHWSLASPTIYGPDDNSDHFYWAAVMTHGRWDPLAFISSGNATLSTLMLMPIYSFFTGLDEVWVWKLFYPFIFSLLPLALFQVYRRQTDERMAFFGAFFFMSFFPFIIELSQKATQRPAELFMGLILLLLVSKELPGFVRGLLGILFAFSLVVSHYGIGYIFGAYILATWIFLALWRSQAVQRLLTLVGRFKRAVLTPAGNPQGGARTLHYGLTSSYAMLFVVLSISWYMYTAGGVSFVGLVGIINKARLALYEQLFAPHVGGTAALMLGKSPLVVASLQREMFRLLLWVTFLLMLIGVGAVLLRRNRWGFTTEYIIMILWSVAFLSFTAVLLPLEKAFNFTRIYHLTLVWLAPLSILGSAVFFRGFCRVLSLVQHRIVDGTAPLALTALIVFVPFFLFNVGFIYRVTGDAPSNIALSTGSPAEDRDTYLFNQQEVAGREWLWTLGDHNLKVFSDKFGRMFLYGEFGPERALDYTEPNVRIVERSYIFLRSINTKEGLVMKAPFAPGEYIPLKESSLYNRVLVERSAIYSNGSATIYR